MPTDAPLVSAITVSLLIVVTLCAITDILEHRIPNIILLPALLLAVFVNSLLAGLPGLIDCIQGLVLGFAMLFPIYFLGGTSAGDVKLLAVVGALFGANGALIAGVATLCFGGVFGVLFICWRVVEPVLATYMAHSLRSSGAVICPIKGESLSVCTSLMSSNRRFSTAGSTCTCSCRSRKPQTATLATPGTPSRRGLMFQRARTPRSTSDRSSEEMPTIITRLFDDSGWSMTGGLETLGSACAWVRRSK